MKIDSVQFGHSVMSDSLRPHESQHTRPPCPSPTPGVHSDSCPSSPWCHPAISSSVVPFSSCPQSLPASGSFLMSQLFAPGGQSIGVWASVSVLPMNIQGWFPLGLTGLIFVVQETLKSLLQHHNLKASVLLCSVLFSWRRKWQPTLYSCLENPMDRGAWWATVHGVAKNNWATEHTSLLYGPNLTYVYDYWKNHSFNYMDLCQWSDVSAF